MVKFFGQPERAVKNAMGTMVFRFDTKGEFITDDKDYIERCKPVFDYIELDAKEVGSRVKVAVAMPKMTIVNNLAEKVKEEAKTSLMKKCKKCDFECDNQGDLLAHYRSAHKEDK